MNMVPIKAFAEKVEAEEIAPEVGDEVPATAVLRIKAVKNGNAEYEVVSINGHDCSTIEGKPPATADKPLDRAALMAAAEQADKEAGY